MNWPTLNYSKTEINRAGNILIDSTRSDLDYFDSYLWAIDVLNNYRSCHSYPVNTFQALLRSKLRSIDDTALVAQRLKREPSIVQKLKRLNGMQLSRMQDIAGLRAVVSSIEKVRELEASYDISRFEHKLHKKYDYINTPKDSGYRSLHLVYKYNNKKTTSYNGLLLEIQIRTKLQHAWATAVETMGIFLRKALKSSEGPKEWLDFFVLAGSAFAHLEGCNPVSKFKNLSITETYQKTINESERLNIIARLETFSTAVNAIHADKKGGSFHLVTLDVNRKAVNIQTFGRRRLEEANEEYKNAEYRISNGEDIQAVLVSAGPVEALKRAYPNFFLDTHEFIDHLKVIKEIVAKQNP